MRNYLREFVLSRPKLDLAPHMRSFVLTKTWSRTYEHEEFFIDVFFSGNRYGAVIYGQLLGQPFDVTQRAKMILMHTTNEESLEELRPDTKGQFKFIMEESGNYQLLLDLDGNVAGVETIEVK